MPKPKVLIVGAGIAGATAARILHDEGYSVTVIDSADHVGGNCYDYYHEMSNGEKVLVQKYGPHIFHTNSERVFEFLSRFTEWEPYTHRVRANLGAHTSIGMTINAKTLIHDLLDDFLDMDFSEVEAMNFLAIVAEDVGAQEVTIRQLLQSDTVEGKVIGGVLWKKIYEPYTLYQWGTTEIDPAVFDRVKIRLDGENENPTYFKDKWQLMPSEGFTAMITNMLLGIPVILHTPLDMKKAKDHYDVILCTASVDQVMKEACPKEFQSKELLPYRTMYARIEESSKGNLYAKFKHHKPGEDPVYNATYNDAASYYSVTRTIMIGEHRFAVQDPIRTTSFKVLQNLELRPHTPDMYCYEYPMQWRDGFGLPRHYPIPRPEAKAMYEEYADLAKTLLPNVIFFGRLGSYQYLNIDQAVGQAMTVAKNFLDTEYSNAYL